MADLRRFLVEAEFRRTFLRTVSDAEVVYFWEREFPLLSGRPQGPVLTRLDSFLAPKPLRHMVSQRENRLDFAEIMNGGKIFLAKLAQGAIGEENAHLLGSLLVSKFQQLTLARQAVAEAERRPFFLYIDEFQNFATPSMAQILSGARKYRLGLTLAHQDLDQLQSRSPELTSAVLTNPAVRICFRVGDRDARKLAEGFSSFGAEDLQSLGVGEAICRVERADWDFNLRTLPHRPVDAEASRPRRERVLALSRQRYATPLGEVEAALRRELPEPRIAREAALETPEHPESAQEPRVREKAAPPARRALREREQKTVVPVPAPPQAAPPLGRGGPQHQYLQELIKRWAERRGWRATIEKPILDGLGSVDVALEREEMTVACEVSVTTSPEHELGNVQKCLAAGFESVVVVSQDRKTLTRARQRVQPELEDAQQGQVHFLTPEELFAFLEEREAGAAAKAETVRGYKVKVQYRAVGEEEKEARRQAISGVIARAVRRLKK